MFITSNGSLPDRINEYLKKLTPKYPNNKFVFSFSIDNIGKKHDSIRKIDGLFEKCIELSYNLVHKFGNNVFGNISITVSLENYSEVIQMYDELIKNIKLKQLQQ